MATHGKASKTGARLWRVEAGRFEARPDQLATEEANRQMEYVTKVGLPVLPGILSPTDSSSLLVKMAGRYGAVRYCKPLFTVILPGLDGLLVYFMTVPPSIVVVPYKFTGPLM